MQSHTINQIIQINVYETEADMPHGLALLWQNFIKYLPTIGLIFIGLVALALVVYIIVKHHKAKNFWKNFGIASTLIILFGWGYWGIHNYSRPLTLGSDVVYIDIIKDTGVMTASANSSLHLAMRWDYGHNTYAKTTTPKQTLGFFSESVSAMPEEDQIRLYINDVEVGSDQTYLGTSMSQDDDYTILAVVDPDITPGTYTEEVEWNPLVRDSMMSTRNTLSQSDLVHSTKTPTDEEPFVDFYPWLNAPQVVMKVSAKDGTLVKDIGITRESIKSIKFEDAEFNYVNNEEAVQQAFKDCTNDPDRPKEDCEKEKDEGYARTVYTNGQSNGWSSANVKWGSGYEPNKDKRTSYDGCWDISEHQSGQVIACYIERVRTEEWHNANLLGWFVELLKPDIETNCRMKPVEVEVIEYKRELIGYDDIGNSIYGDYVLDENGDRIVEYRTMVTSNVERTEDEFRECIRNTTAEMNIKVKLGVYDIVIRQKGGVAAPKDSSGLFYYTGQNTDYCMYSSKALVDPKIPRIIVTTRLGKAIEPFVKWEAMIRTLMIGSRPPDYDDMNFFVKFAVDTSMHVMIEYYLEACHEEYQNKESEINLKNFKTEAVTNMSHMFEGTGFANISKKLTEAKDDFKTEQVEDMSYMFAGITIGKAGDFETKDNLKFDNAKNMAGMFKGSRFPKITITGDTMGVTDMNSMFAGISGEGTSETNSLRDTDAEDNKNAAYKPAEVHIEELQTINVTNMGSMFSGANAKIYASPTKFLTNNVTNMSNMFSGVMHSKTKLDLKHFSTANVTDMSGMFLDTKFSSVDLSSFDTSKVTNMSRMFEGCETDSLDLSNFDTKEVNSMSNMFFNSNVKKLKLGKDFDTKNVTDMSGMFANSQFDGKPSGEAAKKFDTRNVTDMNMMFFNAKNLDFVDVAKFNTSKVTDMSYMFANFRIGSKPQPADFGASNKVEPVDDGRKESGLYVIDYAYKDENNEDYLRNPYFKFGFPKWIEGIIKAIFNIDEREIKNWRTTVTNNQDKYPTHYNTTTNLDLTSFDTSNVENMEGMFLGAQYPKIQIDFNKFNTSKVKNMAYMYAMINANDLQFKGAFDTSNVETMEGMFAGTYYTNSHKLDIHVFKSNNLKNTKFMFAYNKIEPGIYLGNFNPKASSISNKEYLSEHVESGGAKL